MTTQDRNKDGMRGEGMSARNSSPSEEAINFIIVKVKLAEWQERSKWFVVGNCG